MEIITDPVKCRLAIKTARHQTRVGLIPTMGALHDGHLSLVTAAQQNDQRVMVTIFVNPTQFGPGEDFDAYPRQLEQDAAKCEAAGVAWIFAPDKSAMYFPDASTTIRVDGLTRHLCGASRPGHFDGVTTVVAKLFHVAPAHAAYFGEKDFQQLQTIRRMVRDLDMDIDVVGCPIIREPDGLALSSRNQYLSPSQRVAATSLSQALFRAQAVVAEQPPVTVEKLVTDVRQEITMAEGATIDYVELVDETSLEPATGMIDRRLRLCVAVYFGECRLIDNLAVDPTGSVR
ncbi:MAG: pantoate--beta-alanine ligase [Phycisphaerae bacterium]